MSVDNSGCILIGYKVDEVSFENLPYCGDVDNEYDGDWNEWWFEQHDIKKGRFISEFPELKISRWVFGQPSRYERSGYFGFYIQSQSYRFNELVTADFVTDLENIRDFFRAVFRDDEPLIFIGNVQH